MKIDYVLTTKDVKVKSAAILDLVVSDHLPHVAEVE
jgi:endonuclease/exonuclease/phosphatase family metal-dependent hydrolase